MKQFTLTVENYMVVPVDKVKKGSFKPATLDCFSADFPAGFRCYNVFLFLTSTELIFYLLKIKL